MGRTHRHRRCRRPPWRLPRVYVSMYSARIPRTSSPSAVGATFVPRLRPISSLTKAFPTKLTPDATYVVTGGAGALGRTVASYLAERGARHIALLCRSEIPPRNQLVVATGGR